MPVAFSKLLQGAAKEVSKKSDDRVETVTESAYLTCLSRARLTSLRLVAMSVIRMIKMFGWEEKMAERIDEKREVELAWAVIMKKTLDGSVSCTSTRHTTESNVSAAATVFSSIALFDILRYRTAMLFMWVPMVVKGNVSLQRINDFLQNTELLDEFTDDARDNLFDLDCNSNEIGFRNATFSWSNDDGLSTGLLTPSKRRFRLHVTDELIFKRGALNLIVGPT
ncbi:hypothetical protein C0993_012016, partial [Termitomyces sp. T159_Od127]